MINKRSKLSHLILIVEYINPITPSIKILHVRSIALILFSIVQKHLQKFPEITFFLYLVVSLFLKIVWIDDLSEFSSSTVIVNVN